MQHQKDGLQSSQTKEQKKKLEPKTKLNSQDNNRKKKKKNDT